MRSLENYISTIYPSELDLEDTFTPTTEVCYLDTRIKLGDHNSPFHESTYAKRDDFALRIVNFPHMDSNIPTKPASGFARQRWTLLIVFADFLRVLNQQGFKSTLRLKSFKKIFLAPWVIIDKYRTTLREMRLVNFS